MDKIEAHQISLYGGKQHSFGDFSCQDKNVQISNTQHSITP